MYHTQVRKIADADRKLLNDGTQLELTAISVKFMKLDALCDDLTIPE